MKLIKLDKYLPCLMFIISSHNRVLSPVFPLGIVITVTVAVLGALSPYY